MIFYSLSRFFRIFLLSVFILFSTSTFLQSRTVEPTAQKGIIDLKAWNFKTDGAISLKGEWRFFWKQLLLPKDLPSDPKHHPLKYDRLPDKWNSFKINNKKIGPYGYATYTLTIFHNHAGSPLSLRVKEMSSAYELYLDGKKISSNGKIGKTKEESIPEYRPMTVDFTPKGDQTQLTLLISNFNLKEGGPIKKITLGNSQQIHAQNLNRQVINLVLIGLILAMGLYHLILYILLGRYTSPLYFGTFCCLIALRTGLTNDRILHVLFPAFSWEILLRMEYLTFYLAVPVFVLYIASLFPEELSRWMLVLINIFSAILSAVVIFYPPGIFSHTLMTFQIFTILTGLFLINVFYRAHRHGRGGIRVIFIGFIILFICVFYDILGANYIIQSDFSLHIGLFVFIFSQAYLLSLKFSKSLKRIEKQKNQIIETSKQFKNSRIALILGLAKLAEYRDEDTGSHLERIREYAKIIAIKLSKKEPYREYISQDYIDDIYQSSILHDIGKIGIPDAVLLKPGKLTEEEFDIIKTHTNIGGDAIAAIESNSKLRSFLTLGRNIAYYHHEKWNGKGYPKGLKGQQIPLSARIVAIADVYDALTSERPYKKAFSHEKSVDIIIKDSGTHFDPDIIEIFKKLTPQFQRIRKNYFN